MEPHLLTASEAARRIADGSLTAEALVRSCLERIERREAKVRAWAHVDAEHALAEARRLDRSRRPVGPLHGIPVGLKDVIDTADMPTQYNSPIYVGHRPRADADCVTRLRRAGAIILGKTATSEFAGLHPAPTRNPYNLRHSPGGSSSGSAASVGDAMVPLAIGTQTGGSTIRPAAWCGAYAMKPSYARASVRGVKAMVPSYDTLGLIARGVDDLALLDAVLSGEPFRALRASSAGSLRIGYCRTPFWRLTNASTRRVMAASAQALRKAGIVVEPVDLPDQVVRLSDGFYIVVAAEVSWALAGEFEKDRGLLSRPMRQLIERGRAMAAEEIQTVRAAQTVCSLAVDRLFDDYDALLTPAAPTEAVPGRELGNNEFNRMWTAMHMPCVTLPAGLSTNGLPIGLQLVARRGDDQLLLSVAKRVDQILRGAAEGMSRNPR